MPKSLTMLNTIKGSLLEKFYPAGWDLRKIDRCCGLGLKKITTRARFWNRNFKPVVVEDVSEMDQLMGDAIADQIEKTARAARLS